MTDRLERLKKLCGNCISRGEFTLASGKKSDFYFDGRLVTLHPEGADLCARFMLERARSLGATALAGISVGSDPLVSTAGHLAFLDGNPLKMAYVRKTPKGHGKKKLVEGPGLDAADRAVILEDVVTTGGSSLKAADAVKDAFGCEVAAIIVLLDREEGAREAIEGAGLKLESIFLRSDFED